MKYVLYHVFIIDEVGHPLYLGSTESFTEALQAKEPMIDASQRTRRWWNLVDQDEVFCGNAGGVEKLITRQVFDQKPERCAICQTLTERDDLFEGLDGLVCEDCVDEYDMRECLGCGRMAYMDELHERYKTCPRCQRKTIP